MTCLNQSSQLLMETVFINTLYKNNNTVLPFLINSLNKVVQAYCQLLGFVLSFIPKTPKSSFPLVVCRLQSAVSSLKQELRSSASSQSTSFTDSQQSKDSRNSLRQRQVRISEVVTSNDGTRSALKHSSPPAQSGNGNTDVEEPTDLRGRIDAYSKALGPNSYRTMLDDDSMEEIQGTYINEVVGRSPDLSYDGNYRSSVSMSGSYQPKAVVDTRRHSTPRKTPATKS